MAAKGARLLTFSSMITLRESVVLAGAVLSLNMLHIKRWGRIRGGDDCILSHAGLYLHWYEHTRPLETVLRTSGLNQKCGQLDRSDRVPEAAVSEVRYPRSASRPVSPFLPLLRV